MLVYQRVFCKKQLPRDFEGDFAASADANASKSASTVLPWRKMVDLSKKQLEMAPE